MVVPILRHFPYSFRDITLRSMSLYLRMIKNFPFLKGDRCTSVVGQYCKINVKFREKGGEHAFEESK